jgi:hypothetical protein
MDDCLQSTDSSRPTLFTAAGHTPQSPAEALVDCSVIRELGVIKELAEFP